MAKLELRSRRFLIPAVLLSVVVNISLVGVAALLSSERPLPPRTEDAIAVGLLNLEAPEPPQEEEQKPPEPPEPPQMEDFTPDLAPPSLAGPGSLDGGIAIDFGQFGGGKMDDAFVFESYELDQAPTPVVKPAPVYPFRAREQGVEGVVQVKVLVSAEGRVSEVQIMAARPEGIFEDAVVKSVAQWQFRPGSIDGKAVPAWVVTALRFELN